MIIEVARLLASRPDAISAMPAQHTLRAPKRSASMPPTAPKTKYTPPESANTRDTSARRASNSPAKDSKKAAKEYDTPKISARQVKAAHTTTQA